MRFTETSEPIGADEVGMMPRRRWLAGTIALAAIAGCRQEQETPQNEIVEIRSDVPLRVVWVGDADEAETLKRTWASISDQPLEIRVVTSPRQLMANASADKSEGNATDPTEVTAELVRQAASADVLVYPLAMMSELIMQKRLMPLLENNDAATDNADGVPEVFASADRTRLPVALRVATTYSDERLAVPLGGFLPAMLLGENEKAGESEVKTWDDYAALVRSADGKVCEPSAPGWAGAMYLWRLASSLTATWLFERESLEPLFNEPQYVAVLQQMADTVQASEGAKTGRTPSEIYDAVARGELVAGIGFLRSGETSGGSMVRFTDLPVARQRLETDTTAELRMDPMRWMVDPFMLAGSLAASCRQTSAADAFLEWVSGGQGSGPLYRNIPTMVDTMSTAERSSNEPMEQYRVWLQRQLASTNFVTTLQIPGAVEYYGVLDRNVRSCVHGQTSAEDACAEIADRWSRLHRKYDLPAQQRAWRRAQGIA